MTGLAVYFTLALVSSLTLTPVCRAFALRLGYIAKPNEDRWHRKPTALFGGVAISSTVLVLGVTIRPFSSVWQFVLCGLAIAGLGLLDDLWSLKPSTKLIVEIVLASAVVFLGHRLGWTSSLAIDAMLTVFWIVGITNAFNLLDNMDGLAAGVGSIASFFLLCTIVRETGSTAPAAYLATIVGATLGFLVYNAYPASIFMGDTGSLFLGMNIAMLMLMSRPEGVGKSGVLSVMAAPLLLLMIPIFDTTLVTGLRLLSNRRPSQGGRDHTSHRLVAIGLPERTAVFVLWALAAAGGGIALGLQSHDPSWALIAAVGLLMAMLIFAVYLSRIRVYQDADLALLRNERLTPLVIELMYKRRIAEVLLDICLVPLAYYAAYRLRFEGSLLAANYSYFLQSLPVVLAVQLLALFVVGGYRGVWRHFGMMDAVVFAKGVALGTISAVLFILFLYRFESYSRAVFVIYAALLMLLLAGSRASFRLVAEFAQRRSGGQRCLIYGTNGSPLATIREGFGPAAQVRVLGFIDDDPAQRRNRVQGYSVVGDSDDLLAMVRADEVDCVVVNTPLIDVDRLRALERACSERGVEILRLQVQLKPMSAAS
jgi:UDP-GlcNAc:undecaprenyl-phosphate/decaprenyl-phosphate GlcNAc-1-phosphate transferase